MRTYFFRITLLCILQCMAVSIDAHNFEVNGIYYNITSSTDMSVSVTFQGSYYYSYSNEYTGSVTIPQTVTYNSKTYRVISIGDHAFHDCSGLISVEIPNSVTSIGKSAFYDCSRIISIEIPSSVTSIGEYNQEIKDETNVEIIPVSA